MLERYGALMPMAVYPVRGKEIAPLDQDSGPLVVASTLNLAMPSDVPHGVKAFVASLCDRVEQEAPRPLVESYTKIREQANPKV